MFRLRDVAFVGRRCSTTFYPKSMSSLALLRVSPIQSTKEKNKYQLISRKRISTDTIVADALVSEAVTPQLGWSLSHIAMYTVDQVILSTPLYFNPSLRG